LAHISLWRHDLSLWCHKLWTAQRHVKSYLPVVANLPLKPNAAWCVSYQSLSRYWYTDLRLPKLELGLKAGVTDQQRMFTLPRHLIPHLIYPEVRVCPILKFVFLIGLLMVFVSASHLGLDVYSTSIQRSFNIVCLLGDTYCI
jgi:hypothetical protein